ncbi:unnamed protein product [Brugia timori]|uniref:Uncharacterized protein n=1 Tax=Brugia timori TaxID=42155 RepID=A0A0R3R6G4_9BILA|nr:unnamed protein product [Brugia timori]
MVSISCRVTTDRPDLEQERSNPLRCKGCLDESKPSRQEQSVQSIQPDGLPLVTNRGISLLQKNVQPAVSHHLQNKLKTKHLSWKSYFPNCNKNPDGRQPILLSMLLRKLFSTFDVAMLCYSKQLSL